jgi:hypothetical protein
MIWNIRYFNLKQLSQKQPSIKFFTMVLSSGLFEFNYLPIFIGKFKELAFLKIICVDETLDHNFEQVYELSKDNEPLISNKYKFESL